MSGGPRKTRFRYWIRAQSGRIVGYTNDLERANQRVDRIIASGSLNSGVTYYVQDQHAAKTF